MFACEKNAYFATKSLYTSQNQRLFGKRLKHIVKQLPANIFSVNIFMFLLFIVQKKCNAQTNQKYFYQKAKRNANNKKSKKKTLLLTKCYNSQLESIISWHNIMLGCTLPLCVCCVRGYYTICRSMSRNKYVKNYK